MNDINKEEKIVMVNYTKEQKEFYQNMMEEIGNHEDFGKRNPVDIGIDCGYSEEDVTEMIQMCQSEVQRSRDILFYVTKTGTQIYSFGKY